MNIADIMDKNELDRLVTEHYITRRIDPTNRYVLYNYTEKATFDRVWTAETRQCRGIVTTEDGAIVAWPFDKFFNVDETEATRLEALIARTGDVEITNKLDGSMIAIWYADQEWHASTRGSFTSTQAIAALAWLTPRLTEWTPMLRENTLLCEWCAPDNRIVLKYDTPELFLIGARHTPNGMDYSYHGMQTISALTGLRATPRYVGAIGEIAAQRASLCGVEGWVARWTDGFRVKIKTEEYLRTHRLVSNFSAARVRDVLLHSDLWTAYLTELPEEFRVEAETMADAMQSATTTRLAALQARYAALRPLAETSRKEYALAVLQEPADDRPYLFALLDNKPIEAKIMAALDLLDLGFALESVEEQA